MCSLHTLRPMHVAAGRPRFAGCTPACWPAEASDAPPPPACSAPRSANENDEFWRHLPPCHRWHRAVHQPAGRKREISAFGARLRNLRKNTGPGSADRVHCSRSIAASFYFFRPTVEFSATIQKSARFLVLGGKGGASPLGPPWFFQSALAD